MPKTILRAEEIKDSILCKQCKHLIEFKYSEVQHGIQLVSLQTGGLEWDFIRCPNCMSTINVVLSTEYARGYLAQAQWNKTLETEF